ncbi:putative serine/threonine-protein kinase [Citrus sinensis]|uniref:Serine/threonine-protein kinase n=1 Tax=Citrus sinensis TaxID=2711 RepID=A0ACB8K8B0_CITSI|nr:putative serine/threonine-protein kinase [Citrus sinensis]
MGCICSKAIRAKKYIAKNNAKEKELTKRTNKRLGSFKKENVTVVVETDGIGNESTTRLINDQSVADDDVGSSDDGEKKVKLQRRSTINVQVAQPRMTRIVSVSNGERGAQVVAGWPSWLTAVAGEAINGWVPRKADSFEKLDKIGQGTYSSVYKARDLENNKLVALKKVRFTNMDPESVRFMAREIIILRRLDHPNIMKLEGLITSRVSGSLYLVFEYMEHDLAGLAATPGVKFTEAQIKCYMKQLLHGLEHCHSRGILHRDIKGSNLLIDYNGILKIGDFGLANFFKCSQKQPLTSRVVTLWYRPPELLLGSTDYGASVDLWSSGCILAELFAGKPIMPGRTEVEQLHKIFKLCGSPSEEYWKRSKLPHATIFKPQQPYKRCVAETFKDIPSSALSLLDILLSTEPEVRGTASSALQNEFFTTKPLPCDPSSLPKYPPSKEFDVKLRDDDRRRGGGGKGRGLESIRKAGKESKAVPAPDANAELQTSYMHPGAAGLSRFANSVAVRGGHSQLDCSNRVNSQWSDDSGHEWSQNLLDRPMSSYNKKGEKPSGKESKTVRKFLIKFRLKENHLIWINDLYIYYASKKTRMHYSGPILPPGGNLEEMLKEHERQIQQAVRRARGDKTKAQKNGESGHTQSLLHYGRNGR